MQKRFYKQIRTYRYSIYDKEDTWEQQLKGGLQ